MRNDSKPAIGFSDCLYQFIEDLPEENALCELDCREHQCTEREWIMCRHRLSRVAGELMLHGESNPAAAALEHSLSGFSRSADVVPKDHLRPLLR